MIQLTTRTLQAENCMSWVPCGCGMLSPWAPYTTVTASLHPSPFLLSINCVMVRPLPGTTSQRPSAESSCDRRRATQDNRARPEADPEAGARMRFGLGTRPLSQQLTLELRNGRNL